MQCSQVKREQQTDFSQGALDSDRHTAVITQNIGGSVFLSLGWSLYKVVRVGKGLEYRMNSMFNNSFQTTQHEVQYILSLKGISYLQNKIVPFGKGLTYKMNIMSMENHILKGAVKA